MVHFPFLRFSNYRVIDHEGNYGGQFGQTEL